MTDTGTDTRTSIDGSGTFSIGGDLEVHRLGFGAMRLTGDGIWDAPRDHDESIRVLQRARELGVDLIDTADSYGPEVSEDLIREALYDGSGYGGITIATKGGLTRTGPNEWHPVGRPEYLRQCVMMSLRRLGVDQIDVWQLHRVDPGTPREDQFGAVKAFVDDGLVKHVGLSNVQVEDIEAAQEAGLRVVTVQNRYNLADRSAEDVLDHCEQHGIGFIPWAPVASGQLAQAGGPLEEIRAHHEGATASQLALAWLLHRSPVMLPIPGTSSVEHLEDNLAAASIQLTDDEFEAIGNAA